MIVVDDKVISYLAEKNGEQYNLHKASEECQELGLVLNQYILKPGKVKTKEIIDEIGDVILRVEILKKIFSEKEIQDRVNYKQSKYKEYIDSKKYSKI